MVFRFHHSVLNSYPSLARSRLSSAFYEHQIVKVCFESTSDWAERLQDCPCLHTEAVAG
jgi:hypothetical protein